MNKEMKHRFGMAFLIFAAFVLFTLAVAFVDVKPVGPFGSEVGFAMLNGTMHEVLPFRNVPYQLSKVVEYLCFAVVGFFALGGAMQFMKSHTFSGVDGDIRALGVTYIITAAFYVGFDILIVNYRPVLRDEGLEASYPSSHTLLIVVVLGTLALLLKKRIRNVFVRRIAIFVTRVIEIGGVLARLLSGVHWLSDILGGIILALSLVELYRGLSRAFAKSSAKPSGKTVSKKHVKRS